MKHTAFTVFLDTNSLLHYPPIKSVDWKAVCDSDYVRLVLCLQVIHELDEKKDDNRLGDRASRAIKEIKAIRSTGGIVSDGVVLEVFNHAVQIADFPATLSYDSKDDRIVHSVKKFAELNACSMLAVYTEDMGMNLRCEAHGLTVIEPNTESRLENPQSEQDKKYKVAITQLNELKNRVPVVELVISPIEAKTPQKQQMIFSLAPSPSKTNIDSELSEYQNANNLFAMKKTEIASGVQIPTLPRQNDSIAHYNEKLEEHFAEYRKWLETRNLLEILHAHQIKVSVWIVNSGLSPADDLDLSIEIGEPVALVYEASSTEAKSLELPTPPTRPERPRQFFADTSVAASLRRYLDYAMAPTSPIWDERASVEKQEDTNSYRVAFSSKRLKHNEHQHVANLILILKPNAIRPFQLRFRITAANITTAIQGAIPIVVKGNSRMEAESP